MSSFLICLPCSGAPYIVSTFGKDEEPSLEQLKSVVGGRIDMVRPTSFRILPAIVKDNRRWATAALLLLSKGAKVFVNEEGLYTCEPNNSTLMPSGRPLFGDLALVVPKAALDTLRITPESLAKE